MQKVGLVCVGKLKERFYTDAAAEYVKRLGRYCRLTVTELVEQRLNDDPSPAEIERALAREAEAIAAHLNGTVIALCVEGTELSSEALSARLEQLLAAGPVTFVIGGSFGLHPSVKQRAALRLSMSPMTFPHHLARVMLLEQVYRAFQIMDHTRYHK